MGLGRESWLGGGGGKQTDMCALGKAVWRVEEEWTPEPCESPGCDWGSTNWLQLPRFYLCTPSLRMDSSHATKSCVLILLVALLCAERGEMENGRGAGGYNGDGKGPQGCGYTCTSTVCLVTAMCWGHGIGDGLMMGEASSAGC